MKKILSFLKKIDPDLKFVIITTLLWKMVVVAIMLLGSFHNIPPGAELAPAAFTPNGFWGLFSRWDGAAYMRIAKFGYDYDSTLAAFFPLFPLAIRYFSYLLGGHFFFSAVLINSLATVVIGYYLIKLAKLHLSAELSQRAWLYFLFFPAAAFLNFIYTEALFLAFLIPAFYYMRRQNFLLSALLGMGAALTRNIGVYFVIPLFIEVIINFFNYKNYKQLILNILKISLVPLGLGIYMFFLYQKYHDPFYFVVAQKNWGREVNLNLLGTFYHYFKEMILTRNDWLAMEIGHSLLFLVLTFITMRSLRFSYGVYMLIALVIPLLTGKFGGINRYCLVLFPAFFLLSKWSKKSEYLHLFIIMAELMLFSLYVALYVNNYWVA